MLKRMSAGSGVVYYSSPLLHEARVPHAFSTRIGGISPEPFDSMNLGNPSGCAQQDDNERIQRNYRLLQEGIGCVDRTRCWVHQVHGREVLAAGAAFENGQKADALVSDDASKLLAVRVADCVPILVAGDGGRVVGAIHAGWRGVVAQIVPAAVQKLGVDPTGVVAAIGPCIGFDAFEVGQEVVAEFAAVFGSRAPIRRRGDGKGHVDLREAVRLQLLDAGVSADRIDMTDRCTFEHAGEFYSHRREHGITGRMAAVIGARDVR